MKSSKYKKNILVAGASGYVGRQLVKSLASSQYPVRCLVRHRGSISSIASETIEMVQGDALDYGSLKSSLAGIHTAFYLIHSMGSEGDFCERDRRAAQNFAAAAKEQGVKRIIYLGGLGGDEKLSSHLSSRQEVGQILRDSGILTIEFRASIIIGSGSLSFEMIRTLVEKLPIMITPRWVQTLAQPIAIEDVIAYLTEAIEIPLDTSKIFEIGGPDRISYQEIMKEYARQRRLFRLMIPVPILTPYISSLWLGLVTPLYVQIGRSLIESIKNPTIVNDETANSFFTVRPCNIQSAIQYALTTEDKDFENFHNRTEHPESDTTVQQRGYQRGSRIFDEYYIHTHDAPELAFKPIRCIGGKVGWYYANYLWQLRGCIDNLLGGVGMRRSRRDAEQVKTGGVIDFWQVECYQENRLLRLRAEMKLPGRAWLQFEVYPQKEGSIIYQTAIFDPLGLAGRLYWYGLYPVHRLIFKNMLINITKNIREE